ncbi:uncharacterized protein LOC129611122 isoform X2 [Condylostylus longicornis]|uniref:uncharacterized protein LOC129611122 isoform X2 n=1 Tax=Condylostylus longicornis TaxID=2530218 RepID=UPI00244E32A8|nr:uncharacterized protein LOC129611122 isoform X2 [Condylostylus longicornis]
MISNLSFCLLSICIFNAIVRNDQTPTPTTRLIKNCEEVGLFDDLKHVNPFDETFRRAVEESTVLTNEKNTNNLNLPSSEDTLHTPHIIYDDNSNSKHATNKDFEVNKDQLISLKTSCRNRVSENSRDMKKSSKLPLKNNRKITHKKLRMLLPNPKQINVKTIQPQIISLNFQGQIENAIKTSKTIVGKASINNESNGKSSYLIKKKLKSIIKCKSVDKMETNESDINENKNNLAYKSAKERKRAASMRYRSKKHNEICELRKRLSELLSENLFFKEQIKQLQHILFTQHSNCNVTKQQLEKSPNENLSETLKGSTPIIHIPSSTLVLNIPKIIIQQKAEIFDMVSKN